MIKLRPGDRIVDLCCGRGEMLCTWSRAHGVVTRYDKLAVRLQAVLTITIISEWL
nr:hypothetical protein [uncultured Actinoplanes sp.]